jgi:hypothetical protein
MGVPAHFSGGDYDMHMIFRNKRGPRLAQCNECVRDVRCKAKFIVGHANVNFRTIEIPWHKDSSLHMFNLLKPNGYYMYHLFRHIKTLHSAHRLYF